MGKVDRNELDPVQELLAQELLTSGHGSEVYRGIWFRHFSKSASAITVAITRKDDSQDISFPRLLHTNILQFFDAAQDKCKHSPHVRVSARLRCNTLCCASVFSSPEQLVVVSMSSRVRCCLEHDAEFSPITVILWQAPCVIVSEYCILGANLDVLMFDLADSVLR
ncbi:unnamed protein product [Effrenium voratum]|nr:unnamed protein product [Effrenium voratum]